jgi:hypothetical protein
MYRQTTLLIVLSGCTFNSQSSGELLDPVCADDDCRAPAPDPEADLGPFEDIRELVELRHPNGSDDVSQTRDMLEIYWAAGIPADDGGENIFRATRASQSSPWSLPQPVAELCTLGQDYSPDVSPDGLIMMIAADPDTIGPGALGDFYMATRSDRNAPWSAPILLPEISSPENEVRAVLFADGLRVMFSSERVGGRGGYDIYEASRPNTAAAWSNVQPVPSLNTPALESNATITNDGLTVYFHRVVDNQGDIFRATRSSLYEHFSTPMPVAEVNTAADERDPWLSEDHRTLLFSSTRDSDVSRIYQATR